MLNANGGSVHFNDSHHAISNLYIKDGNYFRIFFVKKFLLQVHAHAQVPSPKVEAVTA